MKQTFYQNFSGEHKRKLKAQVRQVKRLRKMQADELEKGFVVPLRKCVVACDAVLKNEMSVERFLELNDALQAHLHQLHGGRK